MTDAIHAGVFVRETLIDANDLTVTQVAALLGVARPNFANVLLGHRAMNVELALKLEELFDVKADDLVRMQAEYDLAQARLNEAEIKAGIKDRVRAMKIAKLWFSV